MMIRHLTLAERHVATGADIVQRQLDIVQLMLNQGLDAASAKKLLQQFQDCQSLNVVDRDRLLGLLQASGAA